MSTSRDTGDLRRRTSSSPLSLLPEEELELLLLLLLLLSEGCTALELQHLSWPQQQESQAPLSWPAWLVLLPPLHRLRPGC